MNWAGRQVFVNQYIPSKNTLFISAYLSDATHGVNGYLESIQELSKMIRKIKHAHSITSIVISLDAQVEVVPKPEDDTGSHVQAMPASASSLRARRQ